MDYNILLRDGAYLIEFAQYCNEHNITFKIIDESNILEYIDQNVFTNEENKLQLNMLLHGI